MWKIIEARKKMSLDEHFSSQKVSSYCFFISNEVITAMPKSAENVQVEENLWQLFIENLYLFSSQPLSMYKAKVPHLKGKM